MFYQAIVIAVLKPLLNAQLTRLIPVKVLINKVQLLT